MLFLLSSRYQWSVILLIFQHLTAPQFSIDHMFNNMLKLHTGNLISNYITTSPENWTVLNQAGLRTTITRAANHLSTHPLHIFLKSYLALNRQITLYLCSFNYNYYMCTENWGLPPHPQFGVQHWSPRTCQLTINSVFNSGTFLTHH